MAAPAAPAAAAAPTSGVLPGGAAGCCTASTTTLARRSVYTHVWRLEGVTPSDFRDTAVGDTLSSGEFVALGFVWCVHIYPSGFAQELAGCVGVSLSLLTPNTTTPVTGFELRIMKHTIDSARAFSTRTPLPEGITAAWGPVKLVPHAQLFASFDAYAPGGVLSVEVKMWQ
jgi:hypothetical protein